MAMGAASGQGMATGAASGRGMAMGAASGPWTEVHVYDRRSLRDQVCRPESRSDGTPLMRQDVGFKPRSPTAMPGVDGNPRAGGTAPTDTVGTGR
jgi:hypothetical protein